MWWAMIKDIWCMWWAFPIMVWRDNKWMGALMALVFYGLPLLLLAIGIYGIFDPEIFESDGDGVTIIPTGGGGNTIIFY